MGFNSGFKGLTCTKALPTNHTTTCYFRFVSGTRTW